VCSNLSSDLLELTDAVHFESDLYYLFCDLMLFVNVFYRPSLKNNDTHRGCFFYYQNILLCSIDPILHSHFTE
jgi:hypothetical protein